MQRKQHGNGNKQETYYGHIPLGPVEPFSSAKEHNLDKVVYRYPRGIATSYGVNFDPKAPQRVIPFFNMNTYQRKEYPHKHDMKTINRTSYKDSDSPLKVKQQQANVTMPDEKTLPDFKTSYEDQYPCWGKPEFHHFKRKDERVTSDTLVFHGETTYGKSFKKGAANTNPPVKLGWEDLEYMFVYV